MAFVAMNSIYTNLHELVRITRMEIGKNSTNLFELREWELV